MTFAQLKEKALGLPLRPGVYIMMDKTGLVIYVGKAKVLKSRVSQYFQESAAHTEKTRAMVSNIFQFDVIIADSEFEALVLENSLIKRHQPRYNILLKDGKGYPFVRVDVAEEYPVFTLAGRAEEDGARYFGPYGGRGATMNMLDALRAALRLPSCTRRFPRDVGKERPCLNYHMGKCEGWCRTEADPAQYRAAMEQAARLLDGRMAELTSGLTDEMEAAAEEMRFEKAALLRDRVRAIELLAKRQKVVARALADTDVVGYHRGTAKSCFVVLHYIGGELAAKHAELLDHPVESELPEIISALVGQYYGSQRGAPRDILLPCPPEDGEGLARMIWENTGRKVSFHVPQRGEKAELVRLAAKNAEEETALALSRDERQSKLMEALGRLLGLDSPPVRIEAFDISNTGASEIVASMTVFERGKPKRSGYRRFRVKGQETPDDYRAMEEVLSRRFARLLEGDTGFGTRPDLLLVDGGTGHTRVAAAVLGKLGLALPVFGMVKDDRHRTRALADVGGGEIGLAQIPALFALIGQIQEETHRFAIEYHRTLRSKSVKGSSLDEIQGVGPATRNRLLAHFKSIKAIRAANLDELSAVVPKNAARAVWEHFQKGEEQPCASSQELPKGDD